MVEYLPFKQEVVSSTLTGPTFILSEARKKVLSKAKGSYPNSMFSKKKFIFIFIILACMTGVMGFYVGIHYVTVQKVIQPSVSATPDTQANFSTFWQTWNTIKDNFVNIDQLDEQKLIYEATSGLVGALDDPHSIFFTPEEAKIFEDNLSGIFEGVGMEIGIKDNQLVVISPLDNTPAQKAGLLPGDKIVKINDQFTQNLNLEECVQSIRGPKGTTVSLIVSRDNGFQEKEFVLTRANINIPTVKWEFKEPDIAYIKIYHFYGNTTEEFNRLSLEILGHPSVKKIILDMRNNPGGYLGTVQDVAGWFLKSQQVVAIEQFNPDKENIFVAKGNGKLANYPIVVLMNQGSASGSEILAGALRDNRGIKIIGETSFGKGSVQEPINFGDGSMVKLTVAKWSTPNGICIDRTGLIPDIKVEMDEEDYQNDRDPQLDKAIEIIKQITQLGN